MDRTLTIPPEIAAGLPSEGKAAIVVVVEMDPEDAARRTAAYEQFLSDASEEDSVYDKCRREGPPNARREMRQGTSVVK